LANYGNGQFIAHHSLLITCSFSPFSPKFAALKQTFLLGRILSIDYGGKRTGLAVTDPLKIIATGLGTVDTPKLMTFLKDYFAKEPVELVIIGMPTNWDDTDTHATPLVKKFIEEFKKAHPTLPVKEVDERYTSKLATQAMLQMGLKKKQRQNKKLVDEIAATIMLQEHLQHHL
jgi:putative Holliday junction resolvase